MMLHSRAFLVDAFLLAVSGPALLFLLAAFRRITFQPSVHDDAIPLCKTFGITTPCFVVGLILKWLSLNNFTF
jgi:hypothetical protein